MSSPKSVARSSHDLFLELRPHDIPVVFLASGLQDARKSRSQLLARDANELVALLDDEIRTLTHMTLVSREVCVLVIKASKRLDVRIRIRLRLATRLAQESVRALSHGNAAGVR